MPNVKFLIELPKNLDESDKLNKISIAGTMSKEPKVFSINFVNSRNCTDNIAYQFKVKLHEGNQTIIENYKSGGEWSESEKKTELDIFNESAFSLEFLFDYAYSNINVYQGQGRNFVTTFDTLSSLSEIQSIQVWDDVKKINNFSLSYD